MARVQQHGATPQRMPLADVLSNQGIDGQRTGTARPFPLWRLRAARIGRPSIQLLGSGVAPQARIAGRLTFQPPGRFRSSYGFHQHCPGVSRVCHIPGCYTPKLFREFAHAFLIGVRSVCAGMTALAIGFAAGSLGQRVVGAASAGHRAESALLSVFESIRPKSLNHSASLVHVASLETGFAFKPAVEESEPPVSTSRRDSFGERFLFDQKLASFDERFAGGDISVAGTEDSESNVLNYVPSPGPEEHASQPATGRSTPKLAPAALSPPASAARKRVATAEASKHSISPDYDDSRTAIYDIAARTVYLPNGRRLEAHSGLGSQMDDARYVHVKRQGPTPPNTYKLIMREEPFHGVRAIRLVPV